MKNRVPAQRNSDEVLTELRALVAEAEKLVTEPASEAAEGVLANLRARYDAVSERVTDVYANTKQKVVASAKYTDTSIRDNPYQAMAVAAGVAFLVGLLVGRRTGGDSE